MEWMHWTRWLTDTGIGSAGSDSLCDEEGKMDLWASVWVQWKDNSHAAIRTEKIGHTEFLTNVEDDLLKGKENFKDYRNHR